jgi:hypothetical protein
MQKYTKAEIELIDRFTFDQYIEFAEYLVKQIESKIN